MIHEPGKTNQPASERRCRSHVRLTFTMLMTCKLVQTPQLSQLWDSLAHCKWCISWVWPDWTSALLLALRGKAPLLLSSSITVGSVTSHFLVPWQPPITQDTKQKHEFPLLWFTSQALSCLWLLILKKERPFLGTSLLLHRLRYTWYRRLSTSDLCLILSYKPNKWYP